MRLLDTVQGGKHPTQQLEPPISFMLPSPRLHILAFSQGPHRHRLRAVRLAWISSSRHVSDRRTILIPTIVPGADLFVFQQTEKSPCRPNLAFHLPLSLCRTRLAQPLFIVHTASPVKQPFQRRFRALGCSSSLSSRNCRCCFSTGLSPPASSRAYLDNNQDEASSKLVERDV